METFADWLRKHRKALGLLQSDVAKRAGVSTSYVSTLERGQKHSTTGADLKPERDKVKALAKAVRGDVDEALLLCGYAPPNHGQPPRNVLEFVRALEALGVSHIEMFGGPDVLAKMTPDDFESILSEVRRAVEREIFKKARE
jgi:transcriptional regulator with XRE-family HTH domain